MAAVVVQHVQASGVRSLSDLDIHSSGRIDVTVKDGAKAFDVSCTSTTATIDAGPKRLELRSPTAYTRAAKTGVVSSTDVEIRAGGEAAATTSVVKAVAANATVGTGAAGETTGSYLNTNANSATLVSGSQSITAAAGRLSVRGREHAMIIDNATIMDFNGDRIRIDADVEIAGTLNTIQGSTSTTRVQDPVIEVSTGANTEENVVGGDSGVRIDTVPGAAGDLGYMSSFVAADATPLFVDGTGAVNVSKAVSSRIFDKGFVHSVGSGSKSLGARSSASRLNEPAWNVSGGAIRISRIVPDPSAPGKLFRFTMVMRVSDEGVIEVIRVKNELTFDSATEAFEWSAPELTVMQKCGV
jgi:hypothetical protein